MKCEENLELALEIDPTDPEVYQVRRFLYRPFEGVTDTLSRYWPL